MNQIEAIQYFFLANPIQRGNPHNPEEIPRPSTASKAMQRVQKVFKRGNCTTTGTAD